MLKKLEVLNGELSVQFDPLNTRYTVKMTSEDSQLKLEVEANENDEISIFNNEITDVKTEVVITVYNDEEMMSYYLEVYPLQSDEAASNEDYFSSLEIKTDTYMPEYIAPLIGGICFLIILFLFCILFKKKKKY